MCYNLQIFCFETLIIVLFIILLYLILMYFSIDNISNAQNFEMYDYIAQSVFHSVVLTKACQNRN